jgi:catechol 2,3-dioxygenase-like lactoylglutathione lyase family enzyme
MAQSLHRRPFAADALVRQPPGHAAQTRNRHHHPDQTGPSEIALAELGIRHLLALESQHAGQSASACRHLPGPDRSGDFVAQSTIAICDQIPGTKLRFSLPIQAGQRERAHLTPGRVVSIDCRGMSEDLPLPNTARAASPRLTVTSVTIAAPDPRALADFYSRLLGLPITVIEEPRPGEPATAGWAQISPPSGTDGVTLNFEFEADYAPPTWPSRPGEQQIMEHLDVYVDDLAAATDRAVDVGARLADHQPQERVRVLIDPAGHPFCSFDG